MNTTRREFLGMLGAATAIGSTTAFAFAADNEFRDFDPDAIYDFYDAKGEYVFGRKLSGREWSEVLVGTLRRYEEWGLLESVFVEQSKKEMSFISQDGGKDISVTEAWLREFWRRHKGV